MIPNSACRKNQLPQLALSVLLVCAAALASANELLMKDGSRLVGKVVKKENDTLEFETVFAGVIKVQWAEVSDAYEEQKKQIESSIAGFVSEVDRAVAAGDLEATEAVRSLKHVFVAEVNALDAELTAAELQYVEDKEKVKAEWARQKQSMKVQIAQYKSEFEEKGQQTSEKLQKFEDELSD